MSMDGRASDRAAPNWTATSAVIYAVDFDIITRTQMGAEDVRRIAHARIELNRERFVSRLVETLEAIPCDTASQEESLDARVVIELKGASGEARTLVANRSRMLDTTRGASCDLDEAFWREAAQAWLVFEMQGREDRGKAD